jgi:hypothetical protein
MFDRIDISELQKMLHYRDRRSVKRWCLNNGLRILCDTGSNRQYVIKKELDEVFIKAYDTGQADPAEQNKKGNKESKHKSMGAQELRFLTLLQNI